MATSHRKLFGSMANQTSRTTRAAALYLLLLASCLVPSSEAKADQGGVSFWLPGLFGSLAAVPGNPGVSFSTIYIHPSVEAAGGKNFVRGGAIVAGIQGRGNIVAFGPSYTFAELVFGGRATLSLFGTAGRNEASIDATLTGPMGNTISGHRSDARTAFGDVLWQGDLKWNNGVHNYMVYATGNFPVGAYDVDRLANLGIGFWSVDGGTGYTYFNPQTGYEFSAVVGLTYNFVNPHNDYQNGIDSHLDWGASKFLNQHFHIGVVGYAYQQLTGDSGSGARLGAFKSRVFGVGPQMGYIFPAWDGYQGYVNVKGYKEFGAQNRPEGWNVWLTLAFSPTTSGDAPPNRPRIRR
jgi:hypothetical protein